MAFLGRTGLILSAGFLLAGGILFGIGAANGGTDQVRVMAENGELSIGGSHLFYPNKHRQFTELDTMCVIEDGEYAEAVLESELIRQYEQTDAGWWEYEENGKQIAKKEEIQKLKIDWNSNFSICLIEGDYFQMTIEDSESDCYKINGDSLEIISKKGSFGECMLYIPKDWVGKEIDISIGAGSFYSDFLHADKIKIDVGAGYMEGNSVMADQFDVEVGSGSLILSKLRTKNAEIEIGLGMAEILNGTITEDLDAECGMGGLTLYLTGKESDHNYKVSSTGNLNIGEYSHSGFHSDYEINNHVSSNFEIKCGLGSIDIYFEEINY